MYVHSKEWLVWFSKNRCYETPYSVTGTIQLTGSKQAHTKAIYVKIELSERRKQCNASLGGGDETYKHLKSL